MRKEWLGVALASLVLAACTTPEPQNTAPPQPAYNGPVVEIPGVEPRYEPINPGMPGLRPIRCVGGRPAAPCRDAWLLT